ncbi:MAG TPA: cytochrome b [Devosiaceae bacterium]
MSSRFMQDLDMVSTNLPARNSASSYDGVTIFFHWLTAVLVVALFGSSYWWNALPGGTPMRKWLQAFHVSLGILIVVVFLARVLWRAIKGRKLPAANKGHAHLATRTVHVLLYALLTVQIVLGFLLRWAQAEEFEFFGLFAVPSLFAQDKPLAKIYEALHNYTGWAIVILAGGHAIAALVHHYVLRDGVLRRMLPGGTEVTAAE